LTRNRQIKPPRRIRDSDGRSTGALLVDRNDPHGRLFHATLTDRHQPVRMKD